MRFLTMVNKCCISTCNAEWKPGHLVTFHKFPITKPEVLKLWLDSIPNLDFTPGAYTVICGDHFTRDSFTNLHTSKRRLKRNAVPTLFGSKTCRKHCQPFKQEQSDNYVYKMNSPEEDPNFINIPDQEYSSSNNEDEINNLEETNESDIVVGVTSYNEDFASNNGEASNSEEIAKVPQIQQNLRKRLRHANASTQTMPTSMYRSLFAEKNAKRRIKMLEERLKRREKMVRAVTCLLRTMTENW